VWKRIVPGTNYKPLDSKATASWAPHLVGHSNMQSNIKQKFLLSHENPDIPPSQRV
ncbi:unnamed protein product, partial [Prunus brigantina]